MEENDEGPVVGLSGIMKLTGFLPIMLGLLILVTPRTSMAVGPDLTEYGIYVSQFLGVMAIFFGLSEWLVATHVKENLHIFGRFYALGFSMIALLEAYGWISGLIQFEPKYIFGSMFPVSGAFVLLLYSIKPEQPETMISPNVTS